MTLVDAHILGAVAAGAYHAPHDVLGLHPDARAGGFLVRARRPLARTVTAIFDDGTTIDLAHLTGGVWEGGSVPRAGAYVLRATYDDGSVHVADDPYRHLPTIGELDLHLIAEGRHEQLWRVLGAHERRADGVAGTSFAVWAPHAQAVRIAGDFNGWDGQGHAMRSMGGSGVWELFVPDLGAGALYKFELLTRAENGSSRPTRSRASPRPRREPRRSSRPKPTSGATRRG